jgi:hypothetical protein
MQGRYTVLKTLGQGVSGVVSLVRRRADGRLFASKEISNILPEDSTRAGENASLQKIPEIAVMDLPPHPGIVSLEETIRTRTGIIMIIEYVSGGTLQDFVSSRWPGSTPVPEVEVAKWLSQCCGALELIHRHGIIHRDLKLANILVANEGAYVKISDFGVATCILRNGKEQLADSSVGTPLYMAPEICEGVGYSSKCDVWSLGVCFYEVCSKRTPFHASNLLALARQIMLEPFDLINRSQYSEGLCAIIEGMLTKDPELRPSIVQVQGQLKEYFRYRKSAGEAAAAAEEASNGNGVRRGRSNERGDGRPSAPTNSPGRPANAAPNSSPLTLEREGRSFSADVVGEQRSGAGIGLGGAGRRSNTPQEGRESNSVALTNDERRRIFEENRAIAARNRQRIAQAEAPPMAVEREVDRRTPPQEAPLPEQSTPSEPPQVPPIRSAGIEVGASSHVQPQSAEALNFTQDRDPNDDHYHHQIGTIPPLSESLAEEMRRINAEVADNLRRVHALFPETPRVPDSQPDRTSARGPAEAPSGRVPLVSIPSAAFQPQLEPQPSDHTVEAAAQAYVVKGKDSGRGARPTTGTQRVPSPTPIHYDYVYTPPVVAASSPPSQPSQEPRLEPAAQSSTFQESESAAAAFDLYSPREADPLPTSGLEQPQQDAFSAAPVPSSDDPPATVVLNNTEEGPNANGNEALPTTMELIHAASPSSSPRHPVEPERPASSAREPAVRDQEPPAKETEENSQSGPECKNCSKPSSEAVAEWYCHECRATLCNSCCEAIHGISLFQTHSLFRIQPPVAALKEGPPSPSPTPPPTQSTTAAGPKRGSSAADLRQPPSTKSSRSTQPDSSQSTVSPDKDESQKKGASPPAGVPVATSKESAGCCCAVS